MSTSRLFEFKHVLVCTDGETVFHILSDLEEMIPEGETKNLFHDVYGSTACFMELFLDFHNEIEWTILEQFPGELGLYFCDIHWWMETYYGVEATEADEYVKVTNICEVDMNSIQQKE